MSGPMWFFSHIFRHFPLFALYILYLYTVFLIPTTTYAHFVTIFLLTFWEDHKHGLPSLSSTTMWWVLPCDIYGQLSLLYFSLPIFPSSFFLCFTKIEVHIIWKYRPFTPRTICKVSRTYFGAKLKSHDSHWWMVSLISFFFFFFCNIFGEILPLF